MNDARITIRADRVRLTPGKRQVYPPLSFELAPGSMTAMLGESGTGKTALLLTLAGRMRGWHGRVEVCGLDVARQARHVRQLVGLGVMDGVNDLSEALTAEQHVTEQRLFVSGARRSHCRDSLLRVGIGGVADVRVRSLNAEQRLRLGIALALVRDVRVLVVDDLDRDLDSEERCRVLGLLRGLANDGLTIVYACVDEATAARADVVVEMHGTVAVMKDARADAVA